MKPNKDKKIIVIGLTGAIGSGKSTVSNMLKEFGAKVIDCDKLSREVIKNNDVIREVVKIFGQEVLDLKGKESQIDRKKLGEIVFKDKTKLELLNLIMHERISLIIDDILKNAHFGDIFVLDVPLPIKKGFLERCDVVWVVFSEHENRLKRIKDRDNMSEENISRRINSQISTDDYNKFGDVIINNNGTIKDLQLLVKDTWFGFLKKSEGETL